MGNLPIPRPAVGSPHASKHDEDRLSRRPRGGGAALEIVVPAQDFILCGNEACSGERDNYQCKLSFDAAGK